MASYVIAAIKSWNIENAEAISARYPEHTFEIITDKAKLTADALKKIDPQYIFFPHWSWIIPEDIYGCFNCVVFHMTDLPFGRGGSPLQNLISRGIYATKISAIRVSGGIDTGDIYDKEPVDIRFGNADQILRKISSVIFHTMIPKFIEGSPTPCKQTGEAVVFNRNRASCRKGFHKDRSMTIYVCWTGRDILQHTIRSPAEKYIIGTRSLRMTSYMQMRSSGGIRNETCTCNCGTSG